MDRNDAPPPKMAASDAEASSLMVDAGAAPPDVARVIVWDVPAAIEGGRRFSVRIGIACSSGGRPDGCRVEVRDHEGRSRATATVDEEPWPGTDALYQAEVALVAPEAEGLYDWEATVTRAASATGDRSTAGDASEPGVGSATGSAAEPGGAAEPGVGSATGGASEPGGAAEPGVGSATGGTAEPGGASEPGVGSATGGASEPGGAAEPGVESATGGASEPGVESATGGAAESGGAAEPGAVATAQTGGRVRFGVRVVSAPECRVTVVALDAESRTPVEGARVVAHPYRAVTDERGMAELHVPAGEYRLFVSGRGCIPFRFDGAVTADTTIRAALEQDRELSDADIWS